MSDVVESPMLSQESILIHNLFINFSLFYTHISTVDSVHMTTAV